MVGRGYLRPDITYLRSDMPKPIRRLYEDCIKYNRDDRPLFPQVRLGGRVIGWRGREGKGEDVTMKGGREREREGKRNEREKSV